MKSEIQNSKQPFKTFTFRTFNIVSNFDMRISILAMLVALVFILPSIASAAVLTKPANNLGLVGYWSMNEGVGTQVGDFSGNRNDGTFVGSPEWVDGKYGNALDFDGDNDQIVVSDNPALRFGTEDFAISAWVHAEQLGYGHDQDRFLGKGETGAGQWVFFFSGNNGTRSSLRFYADQGAIDFSESPLYPQVWYHVVMVRDGDNGYLYVDGALFDSTSGIDGIDLNATSDLTIGSTNPGSGAGSYKGMVDEVRMYNRALSASEVAALYNVGLVTIGVSGKGDATVNASQNNKLTNGLAALWSFDGPDISGSTAYDRASSDASSDLLLDTHTGASAAFSLRKLRSAYAGDAIRVRRSSDNVEQDIGFSGEDLDTVALRRFLGAYLNGSGLELIGLTSAFAETPDSAALSITGDIDIQAHVKPDNWTANSQGGLVGKQAASGDEDSYSFYIQNSGRLYLELFGPSTSDIVNSTTAVPFTGSDEGWVRVTLDVSTGIVQFFTSTDGTTWTQLGSDVSTTVSSIKDSTTKLTIGTNRDDGFRALKGTLYKVRMYDGIGGTLVFDANFTAVAAGTESFTESSTNGATVSITTNDGYVTTWYDQSGNGVNAVQATAVNQPRIVNAGALETSGANGKPAVNFVRDATARYMTLALARSQPDTAFAVATSPAEERPYIFDGPNVDERHAIHTRESGHYIYAGSSSTGVSTPDGSQTRFLGLFNGASSEIGIDGTTYTRDVGTDNVSSLVIGNAYVLDDIYNAGPISELIFYDGDKSANYSAIEAEQAEYYAGIEQAIGNPGTITGATPTIGKIGQALSFDGVDDYVDVGDVGSVKTISFWIKADDITSRKVFDIDGTDQIEINASSEITATSFPASTVYVDGSVGATITNDWHHVVITDSTGVSASTFEIGRVSTSYFDGKIDDVRIYDRALTTDEVQFLYRMGR